MIVFCTAALPVAELRVAFPLGIGMGLPLAEVFIICILGNMLPVPFIVLFVRKVFKWMKQKDILVRFVNAMERRAHTEIVKMRRLRMLGLFIFVAIPLPGTGAWTGALIAAMLDMRLKEAVPTILAGVLGSAIIMTFAVRFFTSVVGLF